jgi:serine O-acetyltransferase
MLTENKGSPAGGAVHGISASEPDWSREIPTQFWDPSRKLLRSIRRYQAARGPLAPLIRRFAVLQHRFWTVVTGADIPINCKIGGGLLMPHPNGIVIHPEAEIGPNCLFFQQVTIGANNGLPRIGGHVDIGAGAKVIGDVTLGDHAVIGANAVVNCDVPENRIAVGVPARVL